MNERRIPIFYACDDNFVKYTIVSLTSMIENASKDAYYHIYVLHTYISDDMKQKLYDLQNENFEVSFCDVTKHLEAIYNRLPIRDYYSKTTYYRLFIAEMFPEYDKAIYIDSDTVVQGDMSKLYAIDIGDSYVGGCHEQAMVQVDVYGTYVEKVMGISRHNIFNAGMIVINCKQWREHQVLDKFIDLLHVYDFVVTQDEDYLNVICKDRVYWLDQRWNTEIFGVIPYPIEQACILHYIMTSKPWHYADCRHGDIFWKYAAKTVVYDEIQAVLAAYTDEQRKADAVSGDNLLALAIKETNRKDHYINRLNQMVRSHDRVEILEKIEDYERRGIFDLDVENDPPGRMIMPDEIDYLKDGPAEKLKTDMAFQAARTFVKGLIKDKKLIIKEIRGIENFKNLDSGAIITCNHFNAFDSFAIQMAYDAAEQPKRKFYRVIREGNYTSFSGFYGTLMRHCNTLPLSSNHQTMKKFLVAVDTLLQNGHFILVYPEQSMWWNYRKPKPLKAGAYQFAAKNNVPVLPCFITMKDTDILGEDGFYVQEYTVHVAEPIYPDATLGRRERTAKMMAENAEIWKNIYETEYCIPLSYTTEKQ